MLRRGKTRYLRRQDGKTGWHEDGKKERRRCRHRCRRCPSNWSGLIFVSFCLSLCFYIICVHLQADIEREDDERNTIHSKLNNITVTSSDTTPKWGYILGDMFRKHDKRLQLVGPWFSSWRLMHTYPWRFPGSIATEYLKLLEDPGPPGNEDWDLMLDIIHRRSATKSIQALIPDEHTLVIHLRTGDVIDRSDRPVSDILKDCHQCKDTDKEASIINKFGRGFKYTRGLPYYQEIWDTIQREDIRINRILLITGWHMVDRNHYKSVEYINAVIRFMEDLVDRVEIRLNKDPDEDLLVITNSAYFVKSGGGFSKMLGGLVTRNGGRTFDLGLDLVK